MANTRTVTLSGKLLDSSGAAVSGQTVALSFAPSAGGAATNLPNVTTAVDGSFTATTSVAAPGSYIFTATYAGVAGQFDPSSAVTPATPVTVKTTLSITVVVQ